MAQPLTFHPDTPPTSATPPTQRYNHYTGSDAHQKGPKTLLFVYVRPVDGQMPNVKSPAQFNAEMDNLSQAYYDASFKQTWFGPKHREGYDVDRLVVTEVLDLSGTVEYYRGNFWMLMNHTYAAVRAQGGDWNGGSRDPARFDRVMVFANPKLINSTGLAYVGWAFSWSGDRLDSGVAIHELGHNWGVIHANLWVGDDGIPRNSSGTRVEYGDGSDVMGGGSTLFNAQMKDQLNFLERGRNEMLTVTSSGTYRLFAHTHRESRRPETQIRGLHLPVDGLNRSNRSHILGFRFTNTDDGLYTRGSYDRNAVQVHATGISGSGSHLLDTTPNSREDDDRIDSAIKVGRTFSEGPNVNGTHMYGGVHITPIARGSESYGGHTHEYIDVVVNYGNFPDNQPPQVSFSQSVYTANVGQEVTLEVTATDPDGDLLAFDWDFGNNTYSLLSSPTQIRTYNSPGLYPVRVTVSDMRGGVTEAAAWVNVGNIPSLAPAPPTGSLTGLSYRYYQGIWTQIPDFTSMLPMKTGHVASLSLAPREQNVNFAFVYDGYLDLPATDIYSFRLTSDDGSRLIIGGQTVINNDGLKSSARSASGHIALDAGLHPVRVEFFHRDGFEQLTLRWSSLSIPEQAVPDSALRRADPAGVQAPSVSLVAPLPGSEVLVGSTVQLQAEASDATGVDRVQFFTGSTFLGQAVEAPWTVNWENIPVGPKTIYALAYNVNGAWTISAPLHFEVVSPAPRPSIGINFNPKNEPFGTPSYNEPAGAVYAQPNWHTLVGISANNSDTNRSNPGTEVNDSLGHPSGVIVSWPSLAYNDNHNTTFNGANPATGSGKMFRTFLSTRDSDHNKPTVNIVHIPYTEYDVYVYFDMPQNNFADTAAMKFTVSPDSGPVPAPLFGKNSVSTTNGVGDYDAYDTWVGYKESTALTVNAPLDEVLGNYVVFRGLTARNLTVQADRGNPSVEANLGISGIQIVSMPATTPRAVLHTASTPLELTAGQVAVYAVSLSMAPTENVTVTVQPPSGVVANESSLVFTPANWDQPRAVALHAPSGSGLSLPANLTVTHTLSGDGNYSDAPSNSLPIRVVGLHNPPTQNQEPYFTSTPITAATSGALYTASLSATDPEGDAIFFSASLLPTWLSLTDHGNGTATLQGLTPSHGVNEYPVIVHVTDGKASETQAFTIYRNSAPVITALSPRNAVVDLPEVSNILHLDMEVTDDGLPQGSVLTTTWTQLSGPGTAFFLDAASASTEVTFSEPGVYRLLLTASDGEAETLRDIQVFVGDSSGEDSRSGGLIGYWPFDGPIQEEPKDMSGNGITGALAVNGSASFVPGVSGLAMRTAANVPNTTHRADVNLGLIPNFTTSLWFTADESPPPERRYLYVFGRHSNSGDVRWQLRMDENSRRLRIYARRATTAGIWEISRDLPAGEWVHLVLAVENYNPVNAWINGEAVPLTLITTPVGAQDTDSQILRIGGHRNENQHSWNGLIDEFRLYNRVISESEVTLLAVPGPIHQAPAVLAGEAQSTLPGQDVALAATVDAPTSDDVELQWTQQAGPGQGSFAGASMAETVFTTTLLPGVYRLRLTAEDQAVRVSAETEVAAVPPMVDEEDLPVVEITAPADGSSFIVGETVTFTGTAIDKDENDIAGTAQWISSVDGLLGTGASLAIDTLTEGGHTIHFSATDVEGHNNSTSIPITILPDPDVNQPPTVSILSPANGSSFVAGSAVTLSATASDPEDGDLSAEVVWSSSRDGALGAGASLSVTTLSIGSHTLTATVEDSEELSASAQITLTIQAPPPLLRTYLLNFGDTVYTTDGTRQWQSFRLQQTLGTASAKLEHHDVLLQDTEGATDAGIQVSLTSNVTNNMGRQTGTQVLASYFASNAFDWFTPSVSAQRETGSFDQPEAYWDYTFTGLDPNASVTLQLVIRRTGDNRNIDLVLNPGESNEATLLNNADSGQTQYVSHTASGSESYTLRLTSVSTAENWVAVVNAMALIVEDVTPPPSDFYTTWAAENEIVGDSTDLMDGVPNLLRYALGGDADTPASAFRLVPELSTIGMTLSFTRIDDPRLTYEVWTTEDLLDWGDTPYWSGTGAGSGELQVPALGAQLYLHLRVRRE